jgi:hypothetical protein
VGVGPLSSSETTVEVAHATPIAERNETKIRVRIPLSYAEIHPSEVSFITWEVRDVTLM